MTAQHSQIVCVLLVCALLPPALPTLDILCHVLCCAYEYAKLCVSVCGTTHAYAYVKCVGFNEWMCMPTQTPTLVLCYWCFSKSTNLGLF